MKKSIATVLLSAAVLTLFAGCNKEQVAGNENPSLNTFKATIESPATKTVLDRTAFGGKVEWKANDVIVINEPGCNYKATPTNDNPTIAEFTTEGTPATPIDGQYYAWYPYNLLPEGGDSFVLNDKFNYDGKNLNLMFPMYAISNTTDLSFKNLCGLIEITLKGSKPIDRIEIKDAEKSLSGAFTADENFNAVITDHSKKATMTLLCHNTKLTEEGVAFYLPVPPATYNKLTVKVYSGDGFTYEVTAKTAATIERSMIYPLVFTPDLGTNVHEGIQLWENGPYWATTNIGATCPSDPGLYFRWGETSGQRIVIDPANSSNNYYIGEEPYRVYNKEDTYKHSFDFVNLDLKGANKDQDAAVALWGDGWRMPTMAEIQEFASYVESIEAVTEGDFSGFAYKMKSGKIITFAKSGLFNKAAPSGGIGSSGNGYIWTSDKADPLVNNHNAFRADIKIDGITTKSKDVREYFGIPIRPVRDAK